MTIVLNEEREPTFSRNFCRPDSRDRVIHLPGSSLHEEGKK